MKKAGIAFRLPLHPYVTVFLCAIFVAGLIILVHSRKALVGFQIFTLRRFFFRLRLINVEVEESTCTAQCSHEYQQQNLIHAAARFLFRFFDFHIRGGFGFGFRQDYRRRFFLLLAVPFLIVQKLLQSYSSIIESI